MIHPRIIYGAPSSNTPAGGVKVIYSHSQILCSLDLESYIWHPSDDEFHCTWFNNSIKKISADKMNPETDFIILPEIWASTHVDIFKKMGFKVGIFVQNCYYTHINLNQQNLNSIQDAYFNADLILSISKDTSNYLTDILNINPNKIIEQRCSVNEDLFSPSHKEKTITFMPRKMPDHSRRIVPTLINNLKYKDWKIQSIDGESEIKVAENLSKSIIFLSFSEFEGLGLPPIEAALCGNYVIGYHGQGGKDYWEKPTFEMVEQGDVQDYVKKVIHRVNLIESNNININEINSGINKIRNFFSKENEIRLLEKLKKRVTSIINS
jgi:hypothetical protein